MVITLENNKPVRGDLVLSLVIRNDCVPMAMSVEAIIRFDDSTFKYLQEGKTITVGNDDFKIIKSQIQSQRTSQGSHSQDAIYIVAGLDRLIGLTYARDKAVIKYNASLSEIYRACGAKINTADNDLTVDRFVCFNGSFATEGIAQVLQEQGAIVRYKNNQLAFLRLKDLTKQEPVLHLPLEGRSAINSEFLQRHLIPSYVSSDDNGNALIGNVDKARAVQFIPNKTEQQLLNMTRCLVKDSTYKTYLMNKVFGGDLVTVQGLKQSLVVVTAVQVFKPDSQYTVLHLYKVVQ